MIRERLQWATEKRATRPYMRARFGLAQVLEAIGRTEEAVEHYRELLRLNPGDNQGVRYRYNPEVVLR